MKDYFLRMFTYNEWASGLLIEVLETNKVEDDKILKWMSHISNAEFIWWDRMNGKTGRVAPFDHQSLDRTKEGIGKFHHEIRSWLGKRSLGDLSETFSYVTSRGSSYTNTYQEVLAHLINHGTHHRAQISARLRELGIAPPGTDYIFFIRK